MEREVYLSTHEGIEVLSLQGELLRASPMRGVGALCAAQSCLFCAGADGEIWRLNRHTLMPQSILSGGPGVCDLFISEDGLRLYALLGDADSILMSSVQSGKAQVVNRCGCNPRHMTFGGKTLAAAGGESGCVHLFDPYTLDGCGEISMPGPVCSAALREGSVFALCLTSELNAVLAAQTGGCRRELALEGMPGCLCLERDVLLAATCGWLYAFSVNDLHLLLRRRAPGRASSICVYERSIFLYDPLSECVWVSRSGGPWLSYRSRVRAMVIG